MEEDFFTSRKEGKKKRKLASHKDRSKFKKTDSGKREALLEKKQREKMANKDLLNGRVLSILPEEILVEHESQFYKCSLRGVLKKERTKRKNLIVVGDFVLFDPHALAIYSIEERQSALSKKSSLYNDKEQLVAANIDFVLITASCLSPPLNLALIDRYIIATRKGNMEPIIVINKIDLLEDKSKENAFLEEAISLYKELQIPLIAVSVKTGTGIDLLKKKIKGHSSVFAGETGVGKTSLINEITGLNLRTREVTEKLKRGTHTTTGACLIPLAFGGFCIDTPGIQKFGLWDLKREDLDENFYDIAHLKKYCHFPDCTHAHEPHCAVQKSVNEGHLSRLRFASYLTLLEEIAP